MKPIVLLAGALALFGTAGQVSAAVMFSAPAQRGLDAMRELNVISFGDLTNGHSIEGRTFVGGNLSGGNYGNGSVTTPSLGFKSSTRATVTVVGNAKNFTINNGNNGQSGLKVDDGAVARAQIGGNAQGVTLNNVPQTGVANIQVGGAFNAQNFNPNARKQAQYGTSASGVQTQDRPFVTKVSTLSSLSTDLAGQRDQLKTDLQALSDQLRTQQSTSVATYTNNRLTFDARAVTGPVAVFNIAGTMLNANGEMFFNLPVRDGSPLTTIINVSGTSITHRINANSGLAPAIPSVIWNFYEATSVNLQTSLFGSALASKAHITNGGRIDGSVVAAKLTQNAQIHLGTFNGFKSNGVAAVPEPAAWGMMIFGLGAVGATIRARRLRAITT